jgi:hypothetical protein
MASLVHKIMYPQLVEAVESLAAKRVVQFALEIGISEGEFEDVRALSSNLARVQFNHIKC